MSNVLQDIFSDYYEHILYELHPRRSVIENIDRMISCGDHLQGGAMYGCPCCGNLKFVPFRCKSRFCPSCGNRYNQQRSLNMSFKLTKHHEKQPAECPQTVSIFLLFHIFTESL